MKKCNAKCEVYSRVCGYFRPVKNWNAGKREEFKDRKTSAVGRKLSILLALRSFGVGGSSLFVLSSLFLLSGCATETIAQGITAKNVSGNGTVVDAHIGLNTDTKIPELRSIFVSGDFATVKAGTNQVSYREESSASVWNASSITKKRFLAITLTDAGDIPAAIKAVSEVFHTTVAKTVESAEK